MTLSDFKEFCCLLLPDMLLTMSDILLLLDAQLGTNVGPTDTNHFRLESVWLFDNLQLLFTIIVYNYYNINYGH